LNTTNSLIEKIPPQSLEAEQAALGAMLLERDAISSAVELLREEDFYRESHRLIFQGMTDLYNRHEPVDLITLGEWLKSRDALESIGGTLFLTTIMSQVPTAAGIAHYCGIIRAKSVQRALIKAADEIMHLAYQGDKDLPELIDESQQKIFAISERTVSSGFVRLQDLVKEQFYNIDEAHASDVPPGSGISTGFRDIDAITAGLHPADLIILAARPSMGKTAMALNIARNVAIGERKTVAIFSVEMAKEQLALRILCSEAGVDQDVVRHSMMTDEDMTRLAKGVENLWNCPIFIDDSPSISVTEMRGKARRLSAEHGLGVILVDYLQLMSSGGRVENRTQEISQIARGLKALARELRVPVVALSQLSRQVETRSPRRPQLSDLRESGAIEQDADLVAFLYRPAYYGEDELKRVGYDPVQESNITEFIVAKQRNGPVNTIRLVWRPEYGQFGDLALHR